MTSAAPAARRVLCDAQPSAVAPATLWQYTSDGRWRAAGIRSERRLIDAARQRAGHIVG